MPSESLFLKDEAATEHFGRLLALGTSDLPVQPESLTRHPSGTEGGIIALHGDLGAGKTTLTRGVMRGYGYQGAVKSPTYTLVEPYEFPRFAVYHFDLYRLSNPEEVEFLGVSDYFDSANLCLIEWPEKGGDQIPVADVEIRLSIEGAGRRLSWEARTPRGERIGTRLIAFGRLE